MTEQDRIRKMLEGQTEDDIIAQGTGVSVDGPPDQYNPSSGQFDIPQEEDPLSQQGEAFGPPAPPEFETDPWVKSPEALRYSRIAQDYKAPSYKEGGVERYEPQQFGQSGTPLDEGEGPNTPIETAQALHKIAEQPGGLEQHQRQHTLGYGLNHQRIKSDYDKYVQASRLERDEARAQQQAKAYTNRENIADREARTNYKMQQLNPGYGGQSSDGAPEVIRKNGLTFVSPRFRPLGADEAAGVNLKNAQAELYRQKPEMAQRAMDVRNFNDISKLSLAERALLLKELQGERTNELNKKKLGAKLRADKFNEEYRTGRLNLDKETAESLAKFRASGDMRAKDAFLSTKIAPMVAHLGKILKMKDLAAEELVGLPWMKSKNPAARDRPYDPETAQLADEASPGDYDEKLQTFRAYAKILRDEGYEHDDDDLEKLREKYYPRPETQ